MAFGPELVLQGASERLVPIIMTVLTTGLALVPLIISGEIPGQEIEYPMAIVILGGLITATAAQLVRRAEPVPAFCQAKNATVVGNTNQRRTSHRLMAARPGSPGQARYSDGVGCWRDHRAAG